MSSILDALEKLEARRTQASGPEPPRRARRSTTPLLAGAAVVAFIAGIGITVAWLRPAEDAPAAPPASVTSPTLPLPPPSPPAKPATPAPRAAPRPAEQPWAEVVAPPSPHDIAAAPPPTPATVARVPGRERPSERAEESPVVAAVEPPPPATTPPRAAARPAGAPAVRVSFLVYSSAPERRTVALAIDEGGMVTLHEGEASAGLSVAQILPDGVELTWQGQSFKVRARD